MRPYGARIVAITAASIVLIEIALRILCPVGDVHNFDRSRYSQFLTDPDTLGTECTHLSLAHASFNWISAPDNAASVHRLNLYGFRDVEWPVDRTPGITRIALVGDSVVEGFLTDDGGTIPAQIRRQARQEALAWEVFNLGIGGNGLPGYVRLLRDYVPVFRPDHVVLVLYANDFRAPAYDPAWLTTSVVASPGSHAEPRVSYVLRSLWNGRRIPFQWHSPARPFVRPVPNPSNPWSDEGQAREFRRFVDPRIADAMRNGTFNPFMVNAANLLRETFLDPHNVDEYLRALKAYLAEHDSTLHAVYVPSMLQVSDYYLPFQNTFARGELTPMSGPEFQRPAQKLSQACTALDINYWDVSALLRQHEEHEDHMYWPYDGHFTPDGYTVVAAVMYEWLRSSIGER